jgi:hypothetical protein
MCAIPYKQQPNHYPPRPQTASCETGLDSSMRVLCLGSAPPPPTRPQSCKRMLTHGRSEGEGVLSYDYAGGLRTSSAVRSPLLP